MTTMYKTVVCPHCGNEIVVHINNETQKCKWCRRLLSVKIKKIGKKKVQCDVEPVDFPPQTKTLKEYEMGDIYGKQRKGRNS